MSEDKQTDNQPAPQVPELLPCPFCGSTSIFSGVNNQDQKWTVSCYDCPISIAAFDRKRVIAAWNTRARVVDGVVATVDETRAKNNDHNVAAWRECFARRTAIVPYTDDEPLLSEIKYAARIIEVLYKEVLLLRAAATAPIAAPVGEVEDRISCQRCGLFGGKVVSFNYDSITTARWVCPHCLDKQENER